MQGALVRLVVAAGCVWAAGVMLPAAASAQTSFSSVPQSTWVTDGHVDAVAVANGHIFLGGAFTQVGPNTGNGVAFDTTSQAIDPAFAQFNGPVDVSIPDGSGGFYVGGAFTNVGGQAHDGVVHLLAGGDVDPSFTAAVSGGTGAGGSGRDAGSGSQVLALALADGKLYMGGNFDHIDGEAHSNLGAVSASTGAVDSGLVENLNGFVETLAASGGSSPRVYAGGSWSSVNGVAGHDGLLSIDPSSDQLDTVFKSSVTGTVYALALNGSDLYLGGEFAALDGQSRDRLAAVSGSDGSVESFAPSNLNGSVYSLAVVGQRLFVAGNSTNGSSLLAYDLSQTSIPLDASFAPAPDGQVDSLAAVASTLYIGGQFENVAGQPHQRMAAIDANPSDPAYGAPDAFNPLPDDTVWSLAVSGNRLFAGGKFGIVGGIHRSNLAALNVSNGQADPGFTANTDAGGAYYGANGGEVDALAVQGTTLYLGGAFGHVNSQSKPYLAAVSTSDGTVVGGFSPSPDNLITGLVSSGSRLYASGSFQNIGGTAQTGVASLYLDTGGADPAFSVTGAGQPVSAIALGDGNLYIDGNFSSLDGVARPGLAAVSPATGQLNSTFSPPSQAGYGGTSLATAPGLVYAGYNGGGNPPRQGAAAFNSADGSLNAWNANFTYTEDVQAMTVVGSQLVLGGQFQSVGGHTHDSLVAVDMTTGAPDQNFTPSMGGGPTSTGEVDALATDGTNLYAGGQFTTVDGLPVKHFAEFGTGAPQGAPVNDSSPSISGTAQEDQTLAADPGGWTGSPTGYSYQWRDCDPSGFSCTDISGATNPDYTLTPSDVGHTIVVRVSATNSAGTSQPAVSPHTDAVSAATSANAPTVTTGASGSVASDSATVNATVDGQGEQTTYWFIYGTDGTTFPDSTPRYSLGNGSGAQSVTGQLASLQPSTTYYYEVVAQNASGTATGAPEQLTTASAPAGGGGSVTFGAVTGAASSILRDAAVVHGLVNPAGTDTSVWFEYGTDTTYGSATSDQDAGTQNGYAAAAQLNGLTPNTTYHYRVVASQGTTTIYGSDHQFTTLGPPTVTTGAATNVTDTSATLGGAINPETSDTHYHFDYGTTPAYGGSFPA